MFHSLIMSMLSESLGGWRGNQPGLAHSRLLESLALLGARSTTRPLHRELHSLRLRDHEVQLLRRLECEVRDCVLSGRR
jgi:hypothetical protein